MPNPKNHFIHTGILGQAGRIFYGIAMAAIGIQMIFLKDFPYMMIPPNHIWIPGLVVFAEITATLLILAGTCIIFEKKGRPVSLLLGLFLFLIFCFYYIPYEFISTSEYMHFGEWENAAKELALSGGAWVIAGSFPQKKEGPFFKHLSRLIPLGPVIFSITIISFAVNHFLYAKDAADYIPSWIPFHMFWIYFAGAALMASGMAMLLNIKLKLSATLLGTMIFIWFIILHIPKVFDSPVENMGGELTSAFLALAYSGTAFAVTGLARKKS